MQYLGGKYRIASRIAPLIVAAAEGRTRYVEPFLGGAAVFERVAPHFPDATGADVVEDLVLMWRAAIDGWVPPSDVTEEDYARLRDAEPSALRGFVGFGCSFGGKWFGGFARARIAGGRPAKEPTSAPGSSRSVVRTAQRIGHARIVRSDYRRLDVGPDTVVYADPPYSGTTGYGASGVFDSAEFWRVAEGWAASGAAVLVSEQSAPSPWESVWTRDLPNYLRGDQVAGARTEHLYALPHTAAAIRTPKEPNV